MIDIPKISESVLAMDRLNSFVRSPACRQQSYWLREHIYRLKGRAISQMTDIGATVVRSIFVMVKRRTCGGDGIWTSYSGDYQSPCRNCSGTGKTRLDFRETTITKTLGCQDWPLHDLVWHSPQRIVVTAEAAGDWKSGTPGYELSVDELCADLNLCEQQWSLRGLNRSSYDLDIGRTILCGFCKTSPSGDGTSYRLQGRRGRITWSASACKSCFDHYKMLCNKYDYNADFIGNRLPFPEHLVTPNVRAWIERNDGLKAVERPMEYA